VGVEMTDKKSDLWDKIADLAQVIKERDEEIERLRAIINEYESVTYLGRNRKP
jgi:hypothetical protein